MPSFPAPLISTLIAVASMILVICLTLFRALQRNFQVDCMRLRVFDFAFDVQSPFSAAIDCVQFINMSNNCLISIIAAEVGQHLLHFPALQRINISVNFGLGIDGVTSIVSSLPGAFLITCMRTAA
jgi:hypothetical protein